MPCLHELPVATNRCRLCHSIVARSARRAARLRGRYSHAINSAAQVPSRGPAALTLVCGDDVATLHLYMRDRAEGEKAATDIVAEVAEDLTIGGIEFKRGTIYDVAAIGRVVDTTEKT